MKGESLELRIPRDPALSWTVSRALVPRIQSHCPTHPLPTSTTFFFLSLVLTQGLCVRHYLSMELPFLVIFIIALNTEASKVLTPEGWKVQL